MVMGALSNALDLAKAAVAHDEQGALPEKVLPYYKKVSLALETEKLKCIRSKSVLRTNHSPCSLDWRMARVDEKDMRTNVVWMSSIALMGGGLEAYMQRVRSIWGKVLGGKH